MIYSDVSYNAILSRMLEQVPDSMDKREGSIIYDALAPAALELAHCYVDLEDFFNECFVDTASRYYLELRCKERGITPYPATYAVGKAEFDRNVPIGNRLSLGNVTFRVVEKISDLVYKVECEQLGEVGNVTGRLIPIDFVQDLETVILTQIIIHGEEEEETESLRSRYYAALDAQSYGGNISDYKEKLQGYQDIGGVKVYPIWNGGGTVKIVFTDSKGESPSNEFVEIMQDIVDPQNKTGEGYGVAPIGHKVTVEGAISQNIDIGLKILYKDGYSFEDVEESIIEAMKLYLNELNLVWADEENLIVRKSRIETRLIDLTGILDILDITINGSSDNFIVDSNSVATLGTVGEINV